MLVRARRVAGMARDEDDFFVGRERRDADGKEKGRDERAGLGQFHRGLLVVKR